MPSKIYWTRQSRDDLRAVHKYIARDAPATATAYLRKLRLAVGRLSQFPLSGEVVPETNCEELREVLQGSYRIIYRVSEGRVDIITVFHSARVLDMQDIRSHE
jgi:plasmid stabilization system protein ParE